MKRLSKLSVAGVIAVLLATAVLLSRLHSNSTNTVKHWSYKIVNTFAHDPNAFTQGLVFEDGVLYEGTGLPGRSELRKVELDTGTVLQKLKLADKYFGEGITIFGDRIIQLTYQSRVGFVYNKETFELLSEFKYPTEGWGITHDGKSLIMSDGTPMLYFLDPETLTQIGKKMVFDQDTAVWGLNELEYVKGEIYANVWPGERIVIIDPQSGEVTGWIDMKGLLDPDEQDGPIDVLNGIAYDPAKQRLFVTGKFWPKLFEVKLVPAK